MNPDPFVFAMANPNPEVRPEEAAPYVRVMATGRSDYPNQINNVLAFPGIFRGALDVRAPSDHRGDEAGGRARHRRDGGRRGAGRGLHHPQRLQPRREPRGGASRSRGGGAHRRRARAPTGPPSSPPARRSSSLKVTVTGATGMIGQRRWSAELRDRGDEVTVLSRDAERPAGKLGPTCERSSGRTPRPSRRRAEALAGQDAVVHLLGEPVAQRWTDEAKREIRDSRVLATRNLVAAPGRARRAERPGVLVSQSASGWYGARGDERVDESEPPADDFLATCASWLGGARHARPRSSACAWPSPAPAWCCRRRAARSRRCCPPSSSASAARWPAAGSTCRGSTSTTWSARCSSPSTTSGLAGR